MEDDPGASIPAACQLCLREYLVESPRWLAGKGRTEEAARALSTAHALVELLCADPGLTQLERERVVGLNAVFMQRRSRLPRVK